MASRTTTPRANGPAGVTALGRFIDLRYASNRFVVGAAGLGAIATAIALFATGGDDPLVWAFRVGAAIFLGWAIARELDPDHPITAAIAGVLSGGAVALAAPEIGALAGFLVAIRIVSRSTGMSAHPWELAGLVVFIGYLAASVTGWPAAIALVAALWIDGSHEHRPHPPARIAAVAAAAIAVIVAAVTFPAETEAVVGWVAASVYVIGIAAAWLAINLTATPRSVGDHDREPLAASRLKLSMLVAGFGLAFAAILTPVGPAAYAPLWTAVVATALVAVVSRTSVLDWRTARKPARRPRSASIKG